MGGLSECALVDNLLGYCGAPGFLVFNLAPTVQTARVAQANTMSASNPQPVAS